MMGIVARVRGASNEHNGTICGLYGRSVLHHGKPTFSREGHHGIVYYWDDRDGYKWHGWWIGLSIGSKPWAYHSDVDAGLPPQKGWHLVSQSWQVPNVFELWA